MPRKPKADESLPGPSPAAYAAAMRALREERGVSVADAAAAAGVPPGRLASVEAGRREADYELMMRLPRALGLRPADLIARAELLDPAKRVPDATILAAIQRAALHRGRGEHGAPYPHVVEQLGLTMGSATGRRMRPRFRELEAAGLIAPERRHGATVYTATREGERVLNAAGGVALPESPQHRRWREGRAAAAEHIGGFRDELRSALDDAAALLAGDAADSDAWHALAGRLERACRRVGSATHCLREWAEPGDDAADVPSDEYRGRRNYLLWGRAPLTSVRRTRR